MSEASTVDIHAAESEMCTTSFSSPSPPADTAALDGAVAAEGMERSETGHRVAAVFTRTQSDDIVTSGEPPSSPLEEDEVLRQYDTMQHLDQLGSDNFAFEDPYELADAHPVAEERQYATLDGNGELVDPPAAFHSGWDVEASLGTEHEDPYAVVDHTKKIRSREAAAPDTVSPEPEEVAAQSAVTSSTAIVTDSYTRDEDTETQAVRRHAA